jgi:hypothetical protein
MSDVTPLRKLDPVANLCRSCNRDFGSLKAFDRHRVGLHGDGRRCLAEEELRAAGFIQNGRGRWSLARHVAHARERFSGEPVSVLGPSGDGPPV